MLRVEATARVWAAGHEEATGRTRCFTRMDPGWAQRQSVIRDIAQDYRCGIGLGSVRFWRLGERYVRWGLLTGVFGYE